MREYKTFVVPMRLLDREVNCWLSNNLNIKILEVNSEAEFFYFAGSGELICIVNVLYEEEQEGKGSV